ncbi:MAG TPA: hypothetical protein VEF33_01900 [Syntrophales bacterium]|nr:hypothetical protein [Syntrophales bacterium]
MFFVRLILIFMAAYASMITFAFCHVSHESDSQVWKVGQRRWTIQEEYNYGKWVETNVTEDFFIRYKIPVDCADVPYAIRWIYARISHLPAAATTVGNRLIGHWSRDWKHLPTNATWHKDRRFRAALIAMLSTTSTRTLPSDTYPIRISADSVTAGTVFLMTEAHSGIVSHIVMDGSTTHPVQTFEASLPTRIQKLHLRNLILPDPDPVQLSGLLKFRWPIETGNQWSYLPVKEHPFYSEEQYSSAFTEGYGDYLEAVAKHIDPKVYDPVEKTKRVINTLNRRLKERIPIVLDGNKKCNETRCPEGSRLWEIYSTPERDEFINVMFDHLEELIRDNHLDRNAILDKMAKIHLQISTDRSVTMQYVFQNSKWLSSDPEATIDARWGLDKCGIIAIHLKSAQESISFIRKTYGETDPKFAERSIWTQQAIVDEMTKEGRKSNCAIGFP